MGAILNLHTASLVGSRTLIDMNLVSLSDFGYRVDEESTAPPSGGNVCMWPSIEFQLR